MAKSREVPSVAMPRGRSVVPASTGRSGEEHRNFPRIPLNVRVEVRIGEADAPDFSAILQSENLSVSGAFLRSTFFLPVETELMIAFRLGEKGEEVRARATLVRHQQGAGLPSGIGVHFEEFYGQTEVALARVFLDARLDAFAETYLGSVRAKTFKTERERVIDALAAWELMKISQGDDLWKSR